MNRFGSYSKVNSEKRNLSLISVKSGRKRTKQEVQFKD